jgi:fatty-acyl-CoA synthase
MNALDATVAQPSLVEGDTDTPLLEETLGAFLDRVADQFADADALIAPAQGVRLSYRALRNEVDRIARGFLSLGLVRGDRLGIWSANRAEWVLTQLAAARIGLVLVTLNPAYRVLEIRHALRLSGCRAVVAQQAHKTSRYHDMLRELTTGSGGSQLPGLQWVIALDGAPDADWQTWAGVAQAAARTPVEALSAAVLATRPDEPINIQFTSGTTGAPKGATLSHRNILNNGYFVGRTLRLTPADRLCLCVPLYHCFGLVMGVLGALSHGAAVVLAGEGFDAAATLDTVQAERCSVLYGVPTMFVALLEEQARMPRAVDSLRTGIMAGAPCPEAVMRDVMQRLCMPEVTICFGMTETSPVSFQSQVDEPLAPRVETVGRVHPHVQACVVSPDGQPVPRGTPGEMRVRGYSVMLGYWNDPERTAEAIDTEGWMHTGDLATIDEDGYARIVGRIKDMLIRGGENIYPREIEEWIFRHDAVAEVQVFGVPDPRWGEEVCAWVRLKPGHVLGAEDLRQWCREGMAHYKVPRHVEFVDSFPMTVTGKVQKHVMRQQMTVRLSAI